MYDLSQPNGHRVKDVKVKCADCEIPEFVHLEPSKVYKVIMSSFLANGGDTYSVITDNTLKRHLIGERSYLCVCVCVCVFVCDKL